MTVGYPVAAGVNNEPLTALRRPPELQNGGQGTPMGAKMEPQDSQNGAPETPRDSKNYKNDSQTEQESLSLPRASQIHQKHIHNSLETSQRTNFVRCSLTNRSTCTDIRTPFNPQTNHPTSLLANKQARKSFTSHVYFIGTHMRRLYCVSNKCGHYVSTSDQQHARQQCQ